MNKKEILLSIGAAIVAVIIYSFAFAPISGTGGAYQKTPTYISMATSGVMAITSSAQILATSTRAGASICNPTSTLVYLNMNADKPASSIGEATKIIAGAAGYDGCYEINELNLYQGGIQASSTGETSVNLLISEYKAR